jgi:hypothetical protein
MRDLRVIWRWMRKLANRWLRPAAPVHSISVFDPAEFSELISSGRKKDLEILAKRLSEHHGKPGMKVAPGARGRARQTRGTTGRNNTSGNGYSSPSICFYILFMESGIQPA